MSRDSEEQPYLSAAILGSPFGSRLNARLRLSGGGWRPVPSSVPGTGPEAAAAGAVLRAGRGGAPCDARKNSGLRALRGGRWAAARGRRRSDSTKRRKGTALLHTHRTPHPRGRLGLHPRHPHTCSLATGRAERRAGNWGAAGRRGPEQRGAARRAEVGRGAGPGLGARRPPGQPPS